MPTPRQVCRAATAAALAVLFVLVASYAPGQPPMKDKEEKKKERFDYYVQIDQNLYDYDTVYCPYELKVDYATDKDDHEVAVMIAGNGYKKDAPKNKSQVSFTIEFPFDTPSSNITAELRPKSTPTDVKDTDSRTCVSFICGGMGFRNAFRLEIPKGAKLAAKAAKAGDPISAGWHGAPFPFVGVDEEPKGYQARMLVQGRYPRPSPSEPVPPLSIEYDLPMEVRWTVFNGKWYPHWLGKLDAPLKATTPMHPAGGGKPIMPETVVRVMLLNDKGKVQRVMLYPHY